MVTRMVREVTGTVKVRIVRIATKMVGNITRIARRVSRIITKINRIDPLIVQLESQA